MKEFFMRSAILLANESKCISKKVGAVIVKEGRIISTGYNGSPVGYQNCCDKFDKDNFEREEHHAWSNANEIHAEMNSIIFAAKNGISVNNSAIYCTLQPCEHCLKNIIQSGIKEVYFMHKYDKYSENESLIKYISNNDIIYEQYIDERLLEFEQKVI